MARDVIVVGSGIVGSAVAYELARRGASVEIVDERAVGMGATQASAGMLAPYHEAREGSPLLALGVRSLDLYDEFLGRAAADGGVRIPYRRTGSLEVAMDDAELRRLQASAAVLSRCGVAATLLDGDQARHEEPHFAPDVAGALLVESHGFVAALDLARALAAAARRCGAQVVEQCRVLRIAPSGEDVIVDTEHGRLTAGAVVLAAGSWSGGVDIGGRKPHVPVRPVRGQLLHLAWTGPMLRRVAWSSRCYLVPWDDGTLLVGATVEEAGFDERATAAGVRDLLEAACDVVPHAWNAGFLGARVGLRPGTPDDLPVIGPSQAMPNLIYATGHYRNGVLLAPLTAALVADMILDGRFDPMLAPLSPVRFGDL